MGVDLSFKCLTDLTENHDVTANQRSQYQIQLANIELTDGRLAEAHESTPKDRHYGIKGQCMGKNEQCKSMYY